MYYKKFQGYPQKSYWEGFQNLIGEKRLKLVKKLFKIEMELLNTFNSSMNGSTQNQKVNIYENNKQDFKIGSPLTCRVFL